MIRLLSNKADAHLRYVCNIYISFKSIAQELWKELIICHPVVAISQKHSKFLKSVILSIITCTFPRRQVHIYCRSVLSVQCFKRVHSTNITLCSSNVLKNPIFIKGCNLVKMFFSRKGGAHLQFVGTMRNNFVEFLK